MRVWVCTCAEPAPLVAALGWASPVPPPWGVPVLPPQASPSWGGCWPCGLPSSPCCTRSPLWAPAPPRECLLALSGVRYTQAARVDLPPSGPAARAQRPSPRLSLSLSCTAGRWLLAGRPHPTARPMLASPMLPPPPRPLPENSFQAGNFWGFAGLVGDRAALTSRPVLHAPSTSAVFAASRGASVAPAGLCDMGPGRGATSGPAPLEGSLGLASQGPQNTPGGGEGCSPTLGNPLTPATA